MVPPARLAMSTSADRGMPRLNLENCLADLLIRQADRHLPVEAARRNSAGSRTSGRLVAAITMTS